MVLLIFLISVLRQIFFVLDESNVVIQVLRLYFDISYFTLPVAHRLQFEFNITTLNTSANI